MMYYKTMDKQVKSIIIASVIALFIGIVALLYFFFPPLSFAIASSAAGVKMDYPVYKPAEFRVSRPVESAPGQITISYTDGKSSYILVAQNSPWDNEGLVANKITPISTTYQTLTKDGISIFRISDQAMWVNFGVLYTISDDGRLPNEEILKIVDGI